MYRLNAGQQQIVDTVRKIADEAIAPRAADVDQNGTFHARVFGLLPMPASSA